MFYLSALVVTSRPKKKNVPKWNILRDILILEIVLACVAKYNYDIKVQFLK